MKTPEQYAASQMYFKDTVSGQWKVLTRPKLLEYLRILGTMLQEAEGAPGGLTHATVRTVHLPHLHELGSILIQIANGVDARKLFGQKGRRRTPAVTLTKNKIASLAYYSARARDPKANDAPAIKAARLFLKKGTKGSINKMAQTNRDWCLETLSKHDAYICVCGDGVISGTAHQIDPVVRADGDVRYIRCWGPKKTATLSKYLSRKRARPQVEK